MNRTFLNAVAIAALLGAIATFPSGSAGATETEMQTTIPATPAEIWRAIDAQIAQLKVLVANNTLKTVHEHAYAVRDLVRALPTHSPSLSPVALSNVSAQVKFVDTLAVRLDESGDANDKSSVAANLTKLEHILNTIRAEYGIH